MLYQLMKKIVPNDSEHVTMQLREVVKDCDIFDRCDPFPIWDECHRGELEKKIIEHYYFREIGFETVGKFKFMLNVRLREIMPRMIEIYRTTLFNYNPIENYNMEEQGNDKRTAQTESVGKFSETPQGRVEDVIEGRYLTNANHGTDQSEGREDHYFTRHGNIGVTTTQQMIEQERNIIIDVDMMIISELKDLFIGVY